MEESYQHESIDCEHCAYAECTDIDGLVYCTVDGHTKDCDMFCEKWKPC